MLIYVCPTCRAKASLDAVLMASVEDSDTRYLIEYLVKHYQPSLGAAILRYLRLHAPPKNRLSINRTRAVLSELLDAIKAHRISWNGREWTVLVEDWQQGFEAVFKAEQNGVFTTHLTNNHYLWGVLANIANGKEAIREKALEEARRNGGSQGRTSGAQSITDLVPPTAVASEPADDQAPPPPAAVTAPKPGPSPYALKLQREIAETQARRNRHRQAIEPADTQPNHPGENEK